MAMVLKENIEVLHRALSKHKGITKRLLAVTGGFLHTRNQFVEFAKNDGDENSVAQELTADQGAEFFKAIDQLKAEKIASDAALAAIFTATEPIE